MDEWFTGPKLLQPIEVIMARSMILQTFDVCNDRRSERRKLAVMRAAVIEIGEVTYFCRIVNVSRRGLELKQYRSSEVGTRVRIRFASDTCISGTVVWSNGNSAGILLDRALDPSLLVGVPNSDPKARRRMPRVSVDVGAVLRVGSIALPVTVFDISPAGARIQSEKGIAGREPASLRIAGLPAIDCRICWVNGDEAGLGFNAALEMRLLEEWIRTARDVCLRRLG